VCTLLFSNDNQGLEAAGMDISMGRDGVAEPQWQQGRPKPLRPMLAKDVSFRLCRNLVRW